MENLLDRFYNNFRSFMSSGVCRVNNIGGLVYKKTMIFEVFGEYLSEFLMFLREIFFVSKILPSYPGNEAQSPDFGPFLTIFGIAQVFFFLHKLLT